MIKEIDNLTEYAKLIAEKINEIGLNKEKVIFGAVGGESIKSLFRELNFIKSKINWGKVHFYMIDEKFLNLNNPDTIYSQLNYLLLEDLVKQNLVPEKNIHPFIYNQNSPDKGVSEYNHLFITNAKYFDIAILSCANDGHVAGLHPNHSSIKNNNENFIYIKDCPKLPSERISASRKLIEKSELIFLLMSGKNKQEVYKKFIDESVPLFECPAKVAYNSKESYVYKKLD